MILPLSGDKQEEGVLVATDGGRCDVDLGGRRRHTVFWEETPSEVRRCTWFYRGSKDGRYLPYPEEVGEILEARASLLTADARLLTYKHLRSCML